MKKKPVMNPFGGDGLTPEQLGAELMGRHYRFRRADKRLTSSGALDIIQSLQWVLQTEFSRIVRLSVWSESQEGAGRSLCDALRYSLSKPGGGVVPVIWEGELRIASEANASAFVEHPLDIELVSRPGGVQAVPELWLDAEPPRFLSVSTMGLEKIDDDDKRIATHDQWWELPTIGTHAPLGILMVPVASPVPVRTSRGLHVPANTPGVWAVALFAPIAEKPDEVYQRVSFDTEGTPSGPTLILRPMEVCWSGLPVPPFYAPLIAMRWFMGQPFIQSEEALVPPEKRREVGALLERADKHSGVDNVPSVRHVQFRRREPKPGEGIESASRSSSSGWWWVEGHVRRIRDRAGAEGATRPVWVTGHPKGALGGDFVGRKQVRHVAK